MTEAAETNSPPVDNRSRLLYSLKPLAIGFLGAGALLIWDAYRHTSIKFGASVDMGTLRAVSATVDGKPFVSGQWVPPGHRKIVVRAADADPVERELFLWLGPHDIDGFQLHRSRGGVTIDVTPAPLEVLVRGEFATNSLKSNPAKFDSLPVGQYQVIAIFEHSREERPVKVLARQMTRVDLKGNVGAVSLSTIPAGADFNLAGRFGEEIRVKGKTPEVVGQLPAGQYVLQVSREDYRKELRIDVKPGETNELKVAFEYAELSVATDPPGATIFIDDKDVGQTPKTITELRPRRYGIKLAREGFHPVSTAIEVKGNESLTISTNLISEAYLAAMERARRFRGGVPPDFDQGLASLEEALKIKPEDAEATLLKEKFVHDRDQALKERQAADLAARRQAVLARFKKATEGERDGDLFDTYTWSFAVPIDALKEALLRALQREPVRWIVKTDQRIDGQSSLVTVTGKRLAGKCSHGSLLLTQFSPEEVIVHAKFCVYIVRPGAELAYLTQGCEGLIPLHPKFVTEESQKRLLEAQRKDVAEEFKKKLMNELR